jgi:hypothetical protein
MEKKNYDNIVSILERMKPNDTLNLKSKWNGSYYVWIMIEKSDKGFDYRRDKVGAFNGIIQNSTKIEKGLFLDDVCKNLKRQRQNYFPELFVQ